MDDRNFDHKTASQWINIIEKGVSSPRDKDIYPFLRDWAVHNIPSNILEIGCGQGACAKAVAIEGVKYFGLEPSEVLLKRAQELFADENKIFTDGNAYALPFKDHFFEAAFSVAVVHLLSDLKKSFLEMSRVLKTGGKFLIITANPAAYELWKKNYVDVKLEGKRFEGNLILEDASKLGDVLYLHSLEEILSALNESGLMVDRLESFRGPQDKPSEQLYVLIGGGR